MSECGQGETQDDEEQDDNAILSSLLLDTTIYVSSYYYICVLILLYMCPHTTVSSYYYIECGHGEMRIDGHFKTKAVDTGSPVSKTADCTKVALGKYTSCTSKVQVLHTIKVPL